MSNTKTFYVTYRVEGRYTAKVQASSLDEARKEAESSFYDADFGELEDIGDCDTYQINASDEEGNLIWEA